MSYPYQIDAITLPESTVRALRPASDYTLDPRNPLSRTVYSLATLAPDKSKPRRKRAPRKCKVTS